MSKAAIVLGKFAFEVIIWLFTVVFINAAIKSMKSLKSARASRAALKAATTK